MDNNPFPEITDIKRYFLETEKRITDILKNGSLINSKIEKSGQFLKHHVGSKQTLVVLYVDLVDSTLMMRDVSVDMLSTIIQMFHQEMSFAISNFNGHVLKYVGDAVIAFFPIDLDKSCYSNAISCAFYMIYILKEVINPVLIQNKYNQLHIRIGIDTGEHSIIQYELGGKHYTDIIGYGISMASKLTKLANPDQITTSHYVYINMYPSLRKRFSELEISPRIWKYIDGKMQKGIWRSLDNCLYIDLLKFL
ncbi:MAG: adenylate/guanylate cyclase domain-containing protein [Candidatus Nitrosocosmicus sp.]